MKLYKIKKKIVKRVIAFLLTLFVTAGSVIGCPAVPAQAAALPAIPALVNYVLTVMGAVSVTDNIVGKVTGDSIITRLTDAITTCLGDGSIYVSADGDYVFNSDSTAAIYEALLNDSNINAKVISSFPAWEYNNNYVDTTFFSNLNSSMTSFGTYLVRIEQKNGGSYNIITSFAVYDISNVSYFLVGYNSMLGYYLECMGSNNSPVSVSCKTSQCTYNEGNYSNNNITSFSDSKLYDSSASSSFSSLSDFFDGFVLFGDFEFSHSLVQYYANRSIVVAKNSSAGSSLANGASGIVYNNYYDIFPSVSQTVIEENNWENIYTSYVNEVNTEYQVSYNENGSVDADELRAILKSVGDRIAEIIEDAGGEIVENLDDIMTWLSRIYDRLGLIESGLSGSGADLSTVEAYLDSIESLISSCATDLDRLQQIYVLLGQILLAINSKGGGGDIVVGLPDVSNTDILEYISKAQVLASLLETVMPFCFVTMFGTLLNQIGVQPVTPVYHVPFTMHNTFVDIDEEVVLDFGIMQDFRDIMYHVWCIAFDILLVWLTFYLLGRVDEILF